MESKKLQQLQQANSHLAPIPQMKPPQGGGGGGYQHPGGYDYGATGTAPGRSAMFPPNAAQYQNYGQPHPSSLRSPYSTGSPKSSLSTNTRPTMRRCPSWSYSFSSCSERKYSSR
uniref:Uncharacterized protein n=1 Tax=Anopheles christyi TaxID=43041 RepID=A0A182KDS7_9DIPT